MKTAPQRRSRPAKASRPRRPPHQPDVPDAPKPHPKPKPSLPLKDSDARLRAVFDTAVEGIVTIDDRGLIDSINPAAERMFGWPPGDLLGRNISTLMPEPYRSGHDGHLARYRKTGQRRIIGIGREVFGRRKDGSVFPIDLSVGEFNVGERRLFTGILRDITERRRLQSEVLRIAEVSQQRIGQDLHDDLCQQLAGIEFLAQTLASRLQHAKRPEASAADEVAALVRSATEYTRNLSHGMSPLRPAPDSLMSALEELAIRTAHHFDVHVDFQCPEPVLLPDVQMATHLYRVAQEAVSNALRHGKARRLALHLSQAPDALRLHVRDHGKGIPSRLPKSAGMGLRIMQYRAGILGGSLAIQREPSGGTSVTCTVPLSHSHASCPFHEKQGPNQSGNGSSHPPRG